MEAAKLSTHLSAGDFVPDRADIVKALLAGGTAELATKDPSGSAFLIGLAADLVVETGDKLFRTGPTAQALRAINHRFNMQQPTCEALCKEGGNSKGYMRYEPGVGLGYLYIMTRIG